MTPSIRTVRNSLLSRGMKYLIAAILVLGAVMLYLVLSASSNTPMFARDLPLLLFLGVSIVLALMVLVGYQLLALRRRLQAGLFGSKLTLRLVLLFSLVAVLPGALVYSVSVQFLNKSIESWFDVRVEKALEGGLSLGRTTLDNMLRELNAKADSMAMQLADARPAQLLAEAGSLARTGRRARSRAVPARRHHHRLLHQRRVGADAQHAAGPGHAAGARAAALSRDRVRGIAAAAVARGGAGQPAVRRAGSAAARATGPGRLGARCRNRAGDLPGLPGTVPVAQRTEAPVRPVPHVVAAVGLAVRSGARDRVQRTPVGAARPARGRDPRSGAGRLQPAPSGAQSRRARHPDGFLQHHDHAARGSARRPPCATSSSSRGPRPTWRASWRSSPPACSPSTASGGCARPTRARARSWASTWSR